MTAEKKEIKWNQSDLVEARDVDVDVETGVEVPALVVEVVGTAVVVELLVGVGVVVELVVGACVVDVVGAGVDELDVCSLGQRNMTFIMPSEKTRAEKKETRGTK